MHGSEGREEERGAGGERREKGKLPSLAAGKRLLVEVCSQQPPSSCPQLSSVQSLSR